MNEEPNSRPAVSPEGNSAEASSQRGNAPKVEPKTDESSAASSNAGYRVELPSFEGPLDLLLHLIQAHELDIMDIPIAFVTEKYLEYVTLMQEINIDVASEYLVMAATLVHIKSRMLLPTPPEQQLEQGEEEVDPRTELVRRLLEYQKYKLAGEELGARDVLGRDVFARGTPAPEVEGPAPLAQVSLFRLLDAFQGVLDRAKTMLDHEINLDRFSITDRILQLADVLRDKQRVKFEDLFEADHSRSELIVTFLALLEMTRLRMTRLLQIAPLDPIYVELAVADQDIAGLADAAVAALQAPLTGAREEQTDGDPSEQPETEPE